MRITREKVFGLNMLFQRQKFVEASVPFHYAVAKNKKILEPEIKALEEAREPSEGYLEYEKKRIALCQIHTEKDENGNPKLTKDPNNGQEVFDLTDEAKEKLDEEMKEVREEFKEDIEEHEKKQKEFGEFIKEEVELNLIKLKLKQMPEKMSGNDVDLLEELELIEE